MPDPHTADEHGLVGVGADLEPGTILGAYRRGLFPMPVSGHLGWWSPDPRGILPIDGLHVSRSLRRNLKRFEVTVDTDFAGVMQGCGDPSRDGGWIDDDIFEAYNKLHRLGWAHSVEVRDPEGALVGGIYGVAIGALFAGESMFHRSTDASKVALVYLVGILRRNGCVLFDVQWSTDHLATLGVCDIARDDYLARCRAAISASQIDLFASTDVTGDILIDVLGSPDGRG